MTINATKQDTLYNNTSNYRTLLGYRGGQELWQSSENIAMSKTSTEIALLYICKELFALHEGKTSWWRNGYEMIYSQIQEAKILWKNCKENLAKATYRELKAIKNIWREEK